MKHKTYSMRKAIIATLIFLQAVLTGIYGQSTYPVQATPTLTPPYSLNLSDYSKFGSQQLMVNITVKDLNISNMPVKLRIKLETMGVTIENPPTINTTPIYIDGGSTTILFGKDLADNFNVKNLIFKGYSKEAYARTGQLPEGFYRFTVEVLHFNNNRPVSNQGTATAWITLGKPPVLKLPLNNTQLGQFKGMPITFSWLASNVGSPVSANSIQYKFEMWEMRIDGIAPNTVAASMPVFHEHTTFNTMYSLYPSTLLMEPGMKYAWRITASDVSGFVPFEQNGQSEIRTFEYKAACDSVTNFAATQRGQSGQFSWDAEENHTSFNVEMRNPGTGWVSNSEAYDSRAEFFDLDYGTTYEMRVQAVCNGDPESTSDYSGWQTLKIEEPEPLIDTATCPDCSCDDEIPQAELTNFELKKDLKPGDTIVNKTGTTRYILEAVEPQGDGIYKGVFLFWAEIWNLQIYCDYWDLQVNTDNVIVNMDFESVYNPQFLLDVDATKEYLNGLAGAINTLTTDTEIKDTLEVNQPITSIYVKKDGTVMAVTVNDAGKLEEVKIHDNANDLEKTLVKGKNGEEYVVTKRGDVMGVDEYKKTGGKKKNIDRYNEEKEKTNLSETAEINFLKSEGQEYGFDAYNEEKMALLSQYPTLNNGYRPAYKSVASYSTDVVETSGDGESTIFKDEMGIPALRTGENLTIRGSADGSEVALYAYQPISDSTEEVAGKLNILSYDENAVKLYIVPVNNAVLPDAEKLQETLNAIYGQAVTEWTVEAKEKVEVSFENGNMVHGESSAFTVYNTDQKAIVKAYENSKNGKLEKGAFYLFFVNNVQFKNRSIAGYMPLQRQVGFIYDSPGLNTIAHELGHGAFNLLHTFSTEKFLAGEGTTQNLMDYKGGTELWKHQWENVQSPEKILFAWSKDEEEGQFSWRDQEEFIVSFLEEFRRAYYTDDKMLLEKLHNYFVNFLLTNNSAGAKDIKLSDGNTYKRINITFDYYGLRDENYEHYVYPSKLPKIEGAFIKSSTYWAEKTIPSLATDKGTILNALDYSIRISVDDADREKFRKYLLLSKESYLKEAQAYLDKIETLKPCDAIEVLDGMPNYLFERIGAVKRAEMVKCILDIGYSFIDDNDKLRLTKLTRFLPGNKLANQVFADALKKDYINFKDIAQCKLIYSLLHDNTLTCFRNGDKIELIASVATFTDLKNKEEEFILHIINTTSKTNADDFLEKLKLKTLPNNTSKSLLKHLNQTMHDVGFGGNNYTKFILSIKNLIESGNKFPERCLRLINLENLPDRHFIWDEKVAQGQNPIGTNMYAVNLLDNGKVSVTRRVVSGVSYSGSGSYYGGGWLKEVYTTKPTIELDPYELIVFIDNSNLGLVNKMDVSRNELTVIPAIFLEYVDTQELKEDVATTVMVSLDAVMLFTGPAAFLKATTWTRRAWVTFMMANAAGNIAMNTGDLPPSCEQAVIYSNYIMIGAGVKELLKLGTSSMRSYYQATKNIKGVGKVDIENFAREFYKNIDDIRLAAKTSDDARKLIVLEHELALYYKQEFGVELYQAYQKGFQSAIGSGSTVPTVSGRFAEYKGIMSKLSELGEASQKFERDFAKASKAVLEKLDANNGRLVESWKVLDNLGETALKTNPVWLKRVSDWDGAGVKLSKNGDNVKLADASGNKIGEFKNGKLLPEKYSTAGTPRGDVINGYQVVDNNGTLALKRVPDRSAYSASELTELTQHSRAHVLERHGHDVTDDALLKRANRGIAPDGSTIGNPNNPVKPPYSSKFDSPDKLKLALNNTKPGSTAFANKVPNQYPNGYSVTFELTDGTYFGRGVPRNGNTFENMNKVIASYEETSPGIFKLVTMYPTK